MCATRPRKVRLDCAQFLDNPLCKTSHPSDNDAFAVSFRGILKFFFATPKLGRPLILRWPIATDFLCGEATFLFRMLFEGESDIVACLEVIERHTIQRFGMEKEILASIWNAQKSKAPSVNVLTTPGYLMY